MANHMISLITSSTTDPWCFIAPWSPTWIKIFNPHHSPRHDHYHGDWSRHVPFCTVHIMSWKILFKKQLFDRGQRSRSLRYTTHHLMVMHPHTKYHWPISKDKNVMAQTRKYYLKNNYLTLRSKVKVPQRSLWYATHHLVVMHPHTKYNWPIWKDKKVMVRTSFAEKKQRKRKQGET